MLTRQDVGHRVAIRRELPQEGGRRRRSDVVGELLAITEAELTIRTTRGDVTIPHGQVEAVRRVPDQRPLSATGRMERIFAAGWPAPEVAQLGDWLLRAADGWTARGNSALAVGWPDRPLPEAVDAVVAWYTERHLPPAIMVPEPIGGRVTAELTARGWRPDPVVLVQTAELDRLPRRAPVTGTLRLDAEPSPAWLAAVAGYKGALPAAAHSILTGVPRTRFAGVYSDPAVGHGADGPHDLSPDVGRGADGPHDGVAAPLAACRGAVADDGAWLGLSALVVAEPVRRRGLAAAVVGALAGWASGIGASRAYLQVEERNTPAVALYRRLGFSTHHRYATWRP